MVKIIKSLKQTVFNPQDKNEAHKNVYFNQLLHSYQQGLSLGKSSKAPKHPKALERHLIYHQAEQYYNHVKKGSNGEARKKKDQSKRSKMSTLNSADGRKQFDSASVAPSLSQSNLHLQELAYSRDDNNFNNQQNEYQNAQLVYDIPRKKDFETPLDKDTLTPPDQKYLQTDPPSHRSLPSTPLDQPLKSAAPNGNDKPPNLDHDNPAAPPHHQAPPPDLSSSEASELKVQKRKAAYDMKTTSIDEFLEASRQKRQELTGAGEYQTVNLNSQFDHSALQRRETRVSHHGYQYGSLRNGHGNREASCNSDLQDLGLIGSAGPEGKQGKDENAVGWEDVHIGKDNIFKNRERRGQKTQSAHPSVFSDRRYSKKDATKQSTRSKNQAVNGSIPVVNQKYSQQLATKSKLATPVCSSTIASKPLKKFSQHQSKKSHNTNSKTIGRVEEAVLSSKFKMNGAEPHTIEDANEQAQSAEKAPTPVKKQQDDDVEETRPYLASKQIQKSAKSLRDQKLFNGVINELQTPFTQSLKVSRSTELGLSLFFPGFFDAEKPTLQMKRNKSRPNGDLQRIGEANEEQLMMDLANQHADLRQNNRSEWSMKKRQTEGTTVGRNEANANTKHNNAAQTAVKPTRRDNIHRSEKRADLKRSLSRTHQRAHGELNTTIEKQAASGGADTTIGAAAAKQHQYPSVAQALLAINQEEKSKIESQANFLARKQKALKQVAEYKEKIAAEKERGNPIICHCVSVEPYIRRAINAIGWRENKQPGSTSFHIKFDVSDIDVKVKPTQFYNHFPDNRHLTTKVGLCKNLCFQTPYENLLEIQSFFPRCFDLSDQTQAELFKDDFQKTAIFSIIKLLAGEIIAGEEDIARFVQLYEKRKEYNDPRIFLKWFEEECYYYDESKGGLRYNELVQQVKQVYAYCRQYIDKMTDEFDYKLFGAPIGQSLTCGSTSASTIKFSQEKFEALLQLHEQIVACNGPDGSSFTSHLIKHLSTSFKVRLLELHDQLERCCRQYAQIDGHRNVWVVKASYNARGVGIFCANKLNDIYQEGKKSQSKVVQKYIERPFLVHKRKFDVRQWVLVTSWEPLDAFVFESAYLKFCSSEFSLEKEDLADVYRHLANYTIQKKNAAAIDGSEWLSELIMSSEEFEAYNQRDIGMDFEWNRDLLPRIQDVVYRTLKAVQETQLSSGSEVKSNCFEIYGFDLVLDQDLNPWVIEINLSPACKERTSWLTKMLDDSALDLLLWIERRILFNTQIERENFTKSLREKKNKYNKYKQNNFYNKISMLNDEETQQENNIKYKWLRIPACLDELEQQDLDQQAHQQTGQTLPKYQQLGVHFKKESAAADKLQNQSQQNLEVLGRKADLKHEKKIQVAFKKIQSTLLIQKVWRGYKARCLATHVRRTLAAIVIQKYARRRAAINARKLLKLHKCTNMVQNQMRRILAKRKAEQLHRIRIQEAKEFVALRLQSHFRRQQATKRVQEVRLHTRAITIQKFLKGMLQHRAAKKLLYERVMIRRIQLYYRRRYQNFNRNACQIQRMLKGYREFKKWQKLKVVGQQSRRLNIMMESRQKQIAFKKFQENRSATKIQCLVRRMLARRKVDALRTERAHQRLRNLSNDYLQMLLKVQLRELKNLLHTKVASAQYALRTFLALKKLRKAKDRHLELTTSSIVVQKFMKGYKQRIEARKLLAVRHESASKIQSLFKMFVTRKGYLSILEEIRALNEEEEEEESRAESNGAEDGGADETASSPIRDFNTTESHAALRQEDSKTSLRGTIQKSREQPSNQRKKSDHQGRQRSSYTNDGTAAKPKSGDRGLKSSERAKRQGSRARRRTKQLDQAIMNRSEKTVRALEDQFYGRSKELDAQVLKSLRKLDAKKQSSRKHQGADGGPKTSKQLVQPGVYGGLDLPKKKEKKHQNGAKTGAEGARGQSSLSFAENLKNLLATQNMQNSRAMGRHLNKPPQPTKPQDVPQAQPAQLFMRHYRPSGPLQASDFMEDFKLSQENFRKSQEQARKIKALNQNSKTLTVESQTVAASVIAWGQATDSTLLSSQRIKQHVDAQQMPGTDQLVVGDESIQELQKLQQLQASYGPSVFLLEQDHFPVDPDEQHELASSMKRKSDLPEIHATQGKAVLQTTSFAPADQRNFRSGDQDFQGKPSDCHAPQPDQELHSANMKHAILSNMTQRKQPRRQNKIKVQVAALNKKCAILFDAHSKPPAQPRNLGNHSQQKLRSTTTGKSINQIVSESQNCYTPQILQASKRPGPEAQKQAVGTDIFMPALETSLTIAKQTSQQQFCDATSGSSASQGRRLKVSSSIGELPTLNRPPQSIGKSQKSTKKQIVSTVASQAFPSFPRSGFQHGTHANKHI